MHHFMQNPREAKGLFSTFFSSKWIFDFWLLTIFIAGDVDGVVQQGPVGG